MIGTPTSMNFHDVYPSETDIYNTLDETSAIYVHNVTACADLGVSLNLDEVAKQLGNVIYDPQEFSCARVDIRVALHLSEDTNLPDSRNYPGIEHIPVRNTKKASILPGIIAKRFPELAYSYSERYSEIDKYNVVKASIFSNGKLSLTGGKSIISVAVALWKLCKAIKKRINKKARIINFYITNILAVYQYPSPIVLQTFVKRCKGSTYDPSRFAGVRFRMPIKAPVVMYDIVTLLKPMYGNQNTNTYTQEDNQKDTIETDSSDSFEEMDNEVSPEKQAPVIQQTIRRPTVNNTPTINRPLKGNIRHFITTALQNNKRTIHQGKATVPNTQQKKKKVIDEAPVNRVWSNENNNQSLEGEGTKEEAITINVYTSGNVLFTGARSIASIQQGLSHIYPFLKASVADIPI
ncbi:Transcription factor TFIID family protein [Babesia bovis T2Bo]|uniref:Uncharacterized protein n=1 Tax=Babesia bovis TaxID=5865 RepID=A7AR08_BABBO|nr:Transcription factor TFIID family protein [Babesia bovis T2Bo]EDO06977.1 Transcription factor TFIID family protein [Babesia bovis T2Bo]|eukprot:XP_001610545.1 hypothetical protein [Babesia bovis T2Bo]